MAIIGISGKKQSGKDTVCSIIQYLTTYPNSNGTTDGGKTNRSYNSFIMDMGMGAEPIWQRKLFADKLKDIVCLLIGCTREQLEDNTFKETSLGEEWNWGNHNYGPKLTPRLLLQLIGTECGRKIIHPNIWVNALMSEYKGVVGTVQKKAEGIREMEGFKPTGYWNTGEQPNVPKEFWNKRISNKTFVWHELVETPEYPNWIITDVRFPNEVKAIKDKGGIIIRVQNDRIKSTDEHESETALDNYKDWDAYLENNSDINYLIKLVDVTLRLKRIL